MLLGFYDDIPLDSETVSGCFDWSMTVLFWRITALISGSRKERHVSSRIYNKLEVHTVSNLHQEYAPLLSFLVLYTAREMLLVLMTTLPNLSGLTGNLCVRCHSDRLPETVWYRLIIPRPILGHATP